MGAPARTIFTELLAELSCSFVLLFNEFCWSFTMQPAFTVLSCCLPLKPFLEFFRICQYGLALRMAPVLLNAAHPQHGAPHTKMIGVSLDIIIGATSAYHQLKRVNIQMPFARVWAHVYFKED